MEGIEMVLPAFMSMVVLLSWFAWMEWSSRRVHRHRRRAHR